MSVGLPSLCNSTASAQPASAAPTTDTSVLLPVVCKESPGSNRGTNCKYRMHYETLGTGCRISEEIRENAANYFQLLFLTLENQWGLTRSMTLHSAMVTRGLSRYMLLYKTNCCASTHKRRQKETEYHSQHCLKHAGYVNTLCRFGLLGLLVICNRSNNDPMKYFFN